LSGFCGLNRLLINEFVEFTYFRELNLRRTFIGKVDVLRIWLIEVKRVELRLNQFETLTFCQM